MSASGRATEFMTTWRAGHGQPHTAHGWGADECERCVADAYDPWEALVWAAQIAWPHLMGDALDDLIAQAKKVSPSPSMTLYVGDVEHALGRRTDRVRGIVGGG